MRNRRAVLTGAIGIAMPTQSSERWIADGKNVVKSLEGKGCKTSPGTTKREPDSGCGRSRPVRAVVTYRSVRSGPPNAQAVGRRTGSSTTRSSAPDGVWRRTAPPPHSATHTHPSA